MNIDNELGNIEAAIESFATLINEHDKFKSTEHWEAFNTDRCRAGTALILISQRLQEQGWQLGDRVSVNKTFQHHKDWEGEFTVVGLRLLSPDEIDVTLADGVSEYDGFKPSELDAVPPLPNEAEDE